MWDWVNPLKQCFSLLIEVCKVIVQLVGGQQLGIQADLVLSDISQVSLSPNAYGSALRLVLSGNQIVVPDILIAQACPFVRDEFFRCVASLVLYCFSGFLHGLLTVIIGKLFLPVVDGFTFLGAQHLLTVGRPEGLTTLFADTLRVLMTVIRRPAFHLGFSSMRSIALTLPAFLVLGFFHTSCSAFRTFN